MPTGGPPLDDPPVDDPQLVDPPDEDPPVEDPLVEDPLVEPPAGAPDEPPDASGPGAPEELPDALPPGDPDEPPALWSIRPLHAVPRSKARATLLRLRMAEPYSRIRTAASSTTPRDDTHS
jgi:hypothetical protein